MKMYQITLIYTLVLLTQQTNMQRARHPSPDDGPTDEEKRTLWVGGISDQVNEELLFELFLNVSLY